MISILTPTRGRPDSYARFIDSVLNTADDEIELLGYVDDDDNTAMQYPADIIVGERQASVGVSWNILAGMSTGDILIMGNDDLIYRTEHWDSILYEHIDLYEDAIYCMYFNDGINGKKHCAFPIISRTWYETLGYFSPECFNFFCHDTWVMDIAKKIDRLHYIPEVFIEHMHFTTKKSKMDTTYKMNRVNNTSRRDLTILEDTDSVREEEAKKLREVMI